MTILKSKKLLKLLIEKISNKSFLYITSLGIYEVYINGNKVGNYFLIPGSTDPRKRIQYDTYDVTSLLKEGHNELTILLSDGWYRGSIGAKGFTYVFGEETQVLAQLEISNDKKIITDETWTWCNDGPITFADLKDGEIIDFNKVPSFNGKVKIGKYDKEITSSNNSHVIIFARNDPIKQFKSKTNKIVYEFENNIAGFISLKLKGKKGSKIHFALGEMIDENEINSELVTLDYINDILLIQKIIDKNYINYFHFQNIGECRNYIVQKYKYEEKSIIQNRKELMLNNIELIENYYDFITIIYKINNNDKIIKLFGHIFVENNKNIGLEIYVNKRYKLTEFFELKNLEQNNHLEIKLKGINYIVNASCMFSGCSSLISLPNISKWNTNDITNIKFMFNECSSLVSLPDISKWNTNNIKEISGMFYGCSSLISLPDISIWNTNNITDMSYMFYGCSSLKSLPDISNWDTSNVTDISGMFGGCSSLISFPDISKWNTINIKKIGFTFYKCSSLISLPDISQWNTSNVDNVKFIFYGCSSLKTLPDISNWNTNNVTDISGIFEKCSSLISLPKIIDNWNISKIKNKRSVLFGCSSLAKIGEINISDLPEKWKQLFIK